MAKNKRHHSTEGSLRASDVRVLLLQHSLLSSCFEEAWKRDGLYEIMNRTLLLGQSPFVMSLYRENNNDYVYVRHSLFDCHLLHTFDEVIQQCHTESPIRGAGTVLLPEYVEELHLFPDTGYACLFWDVLTLDMTVEGFTIKLIRRNGKKQFHPQSSEVIEEDQIVPVINHLFEKLFKAPAKGGRRTPWPSTVQEAVKNNITSIEIGTRRVTRNEHLLLGNSISENSYYNKTNKEGRALEGERCEQLLGREQGSIKQVIEEIYKRFSGGPLLYGSRPAANLLFFVKTFDRSTYRLGCYGYNLQCIIPPTQRAHIAHALGKHKRSLKETSEKIRLANETDAETAKAEKTFRGWLAEGAHGYDKIIARLTENLSDHTRCLVEFPITSGVINYRPKPFDDGRLFGIGPDADKGTIEQERQREVCMRHIFRLMMPDPWLKQPASIMQVPMQVGGTVYACCASIMRDGMPRNAEASEQLIDNEAFFYRYHLYNLFCGDVVRLLRRGMRRAYIDAVTECFKEQVDIIMEEACKQKADVDKGTCQTLVRRLQKDLHSLTRIYPFSEIKICLENDYHKEGRRSDSISLFGNPEARVVLSYEENQFYDRLGNEEYLPELTRISGMLRNRMTIIEHNHGYRAWFAQRNTDGMGC